MIDILLTFFVSYNEPMNDEPVKDLLKIAKNYVKDNELYWHLLPMIPFQFIDLSRRRQDILYMIKMIRIKRGMENYREINIQITSTFNELQYWISGDKNAQDLKRLKEFIEQKGSRIDEIEEAKIDIEQTDYNMLERKIHFAFFLKTIKAIIMITSISYFFAMAFKIVLNLQADVNDWDNWGPTSQSSFDESRRDCSSMSMFVCFEDI